MSYANSPKGQILHLLERTDAKIVALDGNLSPNTLKDVINYCIVKKIDSEFTTSLSLKILNLGSFQGYCWSDFV